MGFARLAALISMLAVYAGADARAAGWTPRPGVEVSGSYGTVTRTSEDSGLEIPGAPYGDGWSVGATAEWTLAPSWGLVSGLRYVEVGQSETVTLTGSGIGGPFAVRGHLHDTWRWLAVPLRARVRPWALPLSFEAGPEVQVLLDAESRQDLEDPARFVNASGGASPGISQATATTIFEQVGTFGRDRDVTDLYHRANYVLAGGVSYAWPARSGRIAVHARGGFGLNDLMKSDGLARRTRTAEVGAAWQW